MTKCKRHIIIIKHYNIPAFVMHATWRTLGRCFNIQTIYLYHELHLYKQFWGLGDSSIYVIRERSKIVLECYFNYFNNFLGFLLAIITFELQR